MTQPAPDTFLSTNHDTASLQLWGRMEGRYRMIRRDYNLPHDRMVCIGYSDIVSRVPRDPQYSAELFQKSAYFVEHDDSDFGIEQEKRVFRLKDGKTWSVWSVGVGDLIRTKLAELDFASPIEAPSGGEQQTSLRMGDQGRMEADGSHYLTVDFFMGIRPHWQLIRKLNDGTGSVPSGLWKGFNEEYFPIGGYHPAGYPFLSWEEESTETGVDELVGHMLATKYAEMDLAELIRRLLAFVARTSRQR